MRAITAQYIDGAFVESHGHEVLDIADKFKRVPNRSSGAVYSQSG
jgi:hypothetical protein